MISFAICATQTVFARLLSLTVIFQAWCIVHAKVSFFDYFHLPYHVYQAHTLSPFFLQYGGSSLNYHFHCLPHNVHLDFCLFCHPKFLCLIIFCSPTLFVSVAIFSSQSFKFHWPYSIHLIKLSAFFES